MQDLTGRRFLKENPHLYISGTYGVQLKWGCCPTFKIQGQGHRWVVAKFVHMLVGTNVLSYCLSMVPFEVGCVLGAACCEQGQKLTEKEKKELEYKRKVYELARMRKKQEEEVNRRDHYHIPDAYDAEGNVNQSSRYSVLTARYRCNIISIPPSTSIPHHNWTYSY